MPYLKVKILKFLILDKISGFEYTNVVSCVYNEIQYLYRRFNTTIKKLNRRQLLSSAACMLINKVGDDACQ